MSTHLKELAGRGGVWPWLVNNGPHGSSFEWGRSPHAPRQYRDLDLLRRVIVDQSAADPSFPTHARVAALELLTEEQPELILRGIQVLCIVGSEEDWGEIERLCTHPNASVRKDARACLFERGIHVASA